MQSLRILFLTPRFPFPLIGGDRIKSYHLLKHLGEQHEVTLVTFNHGGMPDNDQIQAMQELHIRLLSVPLRPLGASLRSVASSLYQKLPLEIAFYTQPEFQKQVDRLLHTEQFDLGIAFFMRTAEYLRHTSLRKILIAEDCRTLYQSRSSRNADKPAQKIIRWWEVQKLKKYEPEIVRHFDITTLVTEVDIKAMREQNSHADYRLLTNGVELEDYMFVDNQEQRKDILFLGNLKLLANELMAHKIVREILPRIQQSLPNTHVHLVGANPPKGIRALVSNTVHIHANVADIQKYYHQAAVFLHPHGGASGIQNKVLQAMAMGCAVITTPTGIQGIEAHNNQEVYIGTTTEELAAHCITLLQQPETRSRLVHNARAMVERRHAWPVIYKQFDDIIHSVMRSQ